MRNTKQRELIYNIVSSSTLHLTAEEVYDECVKSLPNISLGTVYRNLNYLVDDNKIKRIKMPNGVDRFDKNVIHSHVICVRCGRIDDVCINFYIDLPKLSNYDVIDYDLNFNALCERCKKKER